MARMVDEKQYVTGPAKITAHLSTSNPNIIKELKTALNKNEPILLFGFEAMIYQLTFDQSASLLDCELQIRPAEKIQDSEALWNQLEKWGMIDINVERQLIDATPLPYVEHDFEEQVTIGENLHLRVRDILPDAEGNTWETTFFRTYMYYCFDCRDEHVAKDTLIRRTFRTKEEALTEADRIKERATEDV